MTIDASAAIRQAIAQFPDLAPEGLIHDGLSPAWHARRYRRLDPTNITDCLHVAMAVGALQFQTCATARASRPASAFKFLIEHTLGCYITQGAVIAALVALGYRVVRWPGSIAPLVGATIEVAQGRVS